MTGFERLVPACVVAVVVASLLPSSRADSASPAVTPSRLERREGYVDTGDSIIYYVTIGTGPALVLLHGGPGLSHDYLLPFVLPLAKNRQLVLIAPGSGGVRDSRPGCRVGAGHRG